MPTPFTPEERQALIEKYFSRAALRPGVYLANHSLGRPLDQLVESFIQYADLWYTEMDRAWAPWLQAVEEFQSLVANLLPHPEPTTIIPKTSAGQGLRALLSALPADNSNRPMNIVTSTLEFDSIDFILRTYQLKGRANITFVPPTKQEGPVPLLDPYVLAQAITPETDLVVFSQVAFTTGQIIDPEPIIESAKKHQALVLRDTYHSFGVLSKNDPRIDAHVGGSYKYARGGPGACWLAISPDLLEKKGLRTLDTGWFAKRQLFGYQKTEEPLLAEGGRAWWESTPAIAPIYQALPGLRFLKEVGVDRLRQDNLTQQQALQETLAQNSIPVFQPKNPEQYGAFTLLPCQNPDQAQAVVAHLKTQGVTVDARAEFVRLCPDLLNSTEDFDATAEALITFSFS